MFIPTATSGPVKDRGERFGDYPGEIYDAGLADRRGRCVGKLIAVAGFVCGCGGTMWCAACSAPGSRCGRCGMRGVSGSWAGETPLAYSAHGPSPDRCDGRGKGAAHPGTKGAYAAITGMPASNNVRDYPFVRT